MPRLAALAILQAGSSGCLRGTKQTIVQVTSPAQAAELIDQLRADDITLIYDPATRTLRTDIMDSLAVSIGLEHEPPSGVGKPERRSAISQRPPRPQAGPGDD